MFVPLISSTNCLFFYSIMYSFKTQNKSNLVFYTEIVLVLNLRRNSYDVKRKAQYNQLIVFEESYVATLPVWYVYYVSTAHQNTLK